MISNSYPKVTVYIVNHNYGRFIEQAINSVLNQNFRELELLIIDNGSNDNSREIIEKFSEKDRVSILFQENVGLTTNMNNNSNKVNKKTG